MNSTIKFLFYFAVLFVVSCTESTDMLTVINSDGSCYREFNSKVNQAFLLGDTTAKLNPFPVDIDSNWIVLWKFRNSNWFAKYPASKTMIDSIVKSVKSKDKSKVDGEKKSDDFFVLAHRNYASVDDMALNFKLKKSHKWSGMKVKYALEKKFRWFYTYYIYRETYPKIKHDFEIPIEKYMSKDEAQFWFTGKPDILKGMNGVEIREYVGSLENKYNKWVTYNSWNLEYKVLLMNYNKIKKQPVSKARLEVLKDTIFESKVKDAEDFNMEKILNGYFKTNVFSPLWNETDSPLKKFEKDFDDQGFMHFFTESFNYRLIMPGKIIQPNDAVMQGDTLTMKLTAYRMVPADYVIEAQSRKANVWAFILTGIILIIAIGSFVWKPKR
jgi:hypothetical protein